MTLNTKTFGLVLCEGKEDVTVFSKIAEQTSVAGIEIRDYGGKNNIESLLKVVSKSPEFVSGRISKILITRDADEDPAAAIQSLAFSVEKIFCVKPEIVGRWLKLDSGIEIAIWIAPGANRSGMIETLCLDVARSVTPDTFSCLEAYIECLREKHTIELHEKERFAIWTLVAQGQAFGRKSLPFSDALERIDFEWGHETFSEIRNLILECSSAQPN